MIRPWAVLGPVFLVVSACAQFERRAADPGEVQAAIEADPSIHIDPSETEAIEQAVVPQEPPPPPRRKPEAVTEPAETLQEADPDMLIGLDFTVTRALLGEPALQTERSPARIWTYNGQKCMLNVFFYPSVEGGAFRLLTYEAVGVEKPAGDAGASTGAGSADTTSGTTSGTPSGSGAAAAAGSAQASTLKAAGSAQGSSAKQSPDEITAFTRACFTGLLREAEQQRESARLRKAEKPEESGQSQKKEPPLAD